ncbi:MAG: DUF2156 domain-containing protein [Oscillospiraceae bacterium]
MLEFKPIDISDKAWISPLIRCENCRSADAAFGTMYLWSAGKTRYVARSHDRVVLMRSHDETVFLFPFGCGSIVPVINDLKAYCDAIGKPLILVGVPEHYVPLLNKLFPGDFKIDEDTRFADYVYSAEKLATLTGKELHAKRNHINSFIRSYDWRFEPMKKEHIPKCIEVLEQWREADPDHIELDVYDEYDTLLRGLREFDKLGLYGGILWANGELVAFTMGEPLSDDTFVAHFEKAVADIRGAYPMINREFVRYIMATFPEIKYINREDDMGMENIRKAKQSYHPVMMIPKYTAVWGKNE